MRLIGFPVGNRGHQSAAQFLREIALELARRNCHLAIGCGRNIEGVNQTSKEARELGVKATTPLKGTDLFNCDFSRVLAFK